ncbi:uncharacterized protein M6B38_327560 [Iris pallida]|uniref:Uncharacterized protein n=1 Tax=Iris pallida TaxID=29817 RepID=A0AAX6H6F7_IRIPA|nr:uncharacterized protein M6B38_327560 [Iris pallida]
MLLFQLSAYAIIFISLNLTCYLYHYNLVYVCVQMAAKAWQVADFAMAKFCVRYNLLALGNQTLLGLVLFAERKGNQFLDIFFPLVLGWMKPFSSIMFH